LIKVVGTAYSVLSDSKKRRDYDLQLDPPRRPMPKPKPNYSSYSSPFRSWGYTV